ncbi:nucleocapsid protein [Chinese mitten crab virus 1]|uniref:Nucleocapsid protein n=1 Tax=Chinese mitten crab virus 1 TaxID=2849698 RepID=A0A482I9X8_9VIRU|nr:nucleocapsid protein [Chinese mitten crab virus 1]QBP05472.1 nucleocapsid protein [Chinese mitten crab virus 1]
MAHFHTSQAGAEFVIGAGQVAFNYNEMYNQFAALNIKTESLEPVFVQSKNIRDRMKNGPIYLKLKKADNTDARILLEHAVSDQGHMSHKRFFACVARYMVVKGKVPANNPLASSVGLTQDKGEAFTLYTSGMEFNFGFRPNLIAALAKLQKRDLGYQKENFVALTRQKAGGIPFVEYLRANQADIDALVTGLGSLTAGSAIGARAQDVFDAL